MPAFHIASPSAGRHWLAAACLALAANGAAHAAGNLFVNGSFELPAGTSYLELAGGSGAITGWTTVLSGVEWFNTAAQGVGAAADGVMAVDLANFTFASGGLEQAVATTPGQTYDISFYAGSARFSGRDGTGIIKVTIDGGATQSFATATATTSNLAWTLRSFSFVATGNTTTVRFWNDQNPALHFADLDGVNLQAAAVPEPPSAPLALAGLLAMGLAVRRRLG